MAQLIGIDGYEFRVRLLPSIVAGLPLLVAVLFCFPSLRNLAPAAALAALLVGCATLLSEFTRARNIISEQKLRESSCGVRLLTWGDDEIEPRLKKKIHAALGNLLPDYPILNAQEEKADPRAASIYCADIISALIPSFSDRQRYPLIQAGLVSLGFRRNIFELKSYVLWSSRAGAILALLCTIFGPAGAAPPIITLLAACICTGTAIVFDEAVSFDWVCAAERDYVRQLLLGVISVTREPSTQAIEAFDF
jgi:hypothetical protein